MYDRRALHHLEELIAEFLCDTHFKIARAWKNERGETIVVLDIDDLGLATHVERYVLSKSRIYVTRLAEKILADQHKD